MTQRIILVLMAAGFGLAYAQTPNAEMGHVAAGF